MFIATALAMSEDVPGLTAVFGGAALLAYFAWRRGYRMRNWDELFIYVLVAGMLVAGGIARLSVIA